MEIRHLKLVKTVAETGNITKAANVLYLTQSALSHQLRELQDRYQTQIFNRINKEMVPTKVGEKLIEMANNILSELEAGDEEIRNMLSTNSGVVRISTQCYTFYHWLSPIMTTFSKQFPNVELRVVSEATYDTLNYLQDSKLDLAILNFRPKDQNLQITELFEDELNLIVSSKHKLADRKYVKPEELIDENYITYTLPQGYGVTFDQVFHKNDLFPRKITKVQLTEAVIEMVKSNLGISVMANWAVEQALVSGEIIKIKIRKGGMRRKWYAATLKSKERPEYLEGFINAIKKCKQIKYAL